MIKISRGAGVVTPSNPPLPCEELLPLPTPCFKMFLERSLNDPHPTTPLQASFTAIPSPSTTPPLKILIIHQYVMDFQTPYHLGLSILRLARMFYIIYIKKIFDWSKNDYTILQNKRRRWLAPPPPPPPPIIFEP